MLIAWGHQLFRSDPENPAVYVFVKDGVREVAVLPCRGGSQNKRSGGWVANKPEWPTRPSLKDVVYKAPTTQPTS